MFQFHLLHDNTQQAAVAMFGYMTDIETVKPSSTETITAEGDDLISPALSFFGRMVVRVFSRTFLYPTSKREGEREKDREWFKL